MGVLGAAEGVRVSGTVSGGLNVHCRLAGPATGSTEGGVRLGKESLRPVAVLFAQKKALTDSAGPEEASQKVRVLVGRCRDRAVAISGKLWSVAWETVKGNTRRVRAAALEFRSFLFVVDVLALVGLCCNDKNLQRKKR